MVRSTTRILTTHIGSLPRAGDLVSLLRQRERRSLGDHAAFETRVRRAVDEVVRRQIATGLDIVNDGEQGKIDYSTYVKDRFIGFDGEEATLPLGADLKDFPEYAARTRTVASERRPTCSGPIAWKDFGAVERDIANLQRAGEGAGAATVFMTAVSPGQAARFLLNG
jgi:5-methyltetrahydropteroyltriglutamate--homocysteine methyltransferase